MRKSETQSMNFLNFKFAVLIRMLNKNTGKVLPCYVSVKYHIKASKHKIFNKFKLTEVVFFFTL